MNSNSVKDPSNLNLNLGDAVGGGGDASGGEDRERQSTAQSLSSYMLPLVSGGNLQGRPSGSSNSNTSNNIHDAFLDMQNNVGSDTDTCASSIAARRISRDSIVSRDSLSDLIGAGATSSNNNNLMMNMISSQQQMGLNRSMGQLMMNMNQVGQLNVAAASSMMDPSSAGGLADMNPLAIPSKRAKNRHKLTFAQKLMHILSLKETQNAIRWMPNGCAFCIVDSQELVDTVLPKFFKEAKYSSFTRKLNRWGFKHFTLPASEPSGDKEMSIYTHQQFLRDNPALCEMMDGGHRRRSSIKESQKQQDTQDQEVQQLQQNILVMQHVQQLQQNMVMQQQQQQQMMSQSQMLSQNQMGQNQMFDMSLLNNMGRGGNDFYSTMAGSLNNSSNLMGNQGNGMNSTDNSSGNSGVEMRRTSLGFLPYLPASNRRGSGFSAADLRSSFNDTGDDDELNTSNSLENFEKVSSVPTASVGTANSTLGDFKAMSNNANQGGGMGSEGDQAKLAILEEMLAKEHMKQSLFPGDQDPAESA